MAAAEAARSSSGSVGGASADSYVGSLISLTSKSEIRYEGVLFNIDTQELTIGLRNVRSFGTEGRKKDGLQVPPSDKVYEFILFRGTDIKDLQVKSSPPVQTATPVHNDPAIIQSQYPQAATATMNLPSSADGSLTDPSSHASSNGLPRATFQGSLPQYQPGASLEPWGSLHLPPTTNGSGLAMPMYWQGYYGPSNGVQASQQALLRPPPSLSMPSSMLQYVQYPAMNASNTSASPLLENPPPLLPPISASTLNLQTSTLPSWSSAMVSDSTNLIPDRFSAQTHPSNLPSASPLTTAVDKVAVASSGSDIPNTMPDPIMPFKSISDPPTSFFMASSSLMNEGKTPSLVTPGQLLQPAPHTMPSLQSSHIAQRDVEVVQVPSPELSPPPPPPPAVTEVQEPILPLPLQPEHKIYGAPMYTYQSSRGGRGRGRGNEIAHSATRFEEDFDFTAMNEKFNKEEVWGHLGKSHKAQDRDDLQDEDDVGSSKHVTKPVYVKDDFFDSISCGALDGGSRNGRARFSQQSTRDTNAFGNFSHHRGGRGGWGPDRGGWGPDRGGRSRGGYHGRGYGYGYAGRGRGYGNDAF